MIYQHQVAKIGYFHSNHCEDYVYSGSIGEHKILLSVFDGCTVGDESYFASILFGRILRKLAKDAYYQERFQENDSDLKARLKLLMKQFFKETLSVKNALYLEKRELLSTVLFGIVDLEDQCGEFLCVGDGVICVNQQLYEFDQDNQPDYLAYHLEESFDDWYSSLNQRVSVADIEDVSLATDGIFTFSDKDEISKNNYTKGLEYLLFDDTDLDNEHMFRKKLSIIEQEWRLIHTDDIGIVRLVME